MTISSSHWHGGLFKDEPLLWAGFLELQPEYRIAPLGFTRHTSGAVNQNLLRYHRTGKLDEVE